MKRKRPAKQPEGAEPATPSHDVPQFRLDQFAAHQFLQTLRRHAGQTRRADAPNGVAAPHFVGEKS
ncbi:MAG: hypothetical protein JNG90_15840 [Planctomycetaceae bacterium]|nr:hypothetical protein [Planctomycetaceae bacterium]